MPFLNAVLLLAVKGACNMTRCDLLGGFWVGHFKIHQEKQRQGANKCHRRPRQQKEKHCCPLFRGLSEKLRYLSISKIKPLAWSTFIMILTSLNYKQLHFHTLISKLYWPVAFQLQVIFKIRRHWGLSCWCADHCRKMWNWLCPWTILCWVIWPALCVGCYLLLCKLTLFLLFRFWRSSVKIWTTIKCMISVLVKA